MVVVMVKVVTKQRLLQGVMVVVAAAVESSSTRASNAPDIEGECFEKVAAVD